MINGDQPLDLASNNFECHVALVTPEVHWSTGNIGRTCLGSGACLRLIRPLGFSLDSRQVKRAGLDYWPKVRLFIWDNFADFKKQMNPIKEEIAIFTKNGSKFSGKCRLLKGFF